MESKRPEKVRVSIGTATVLGMEFVQSDCIPTTAYLQTYYEGRCSANCAFCAQARSSGANLDRISRGLYPPYPTDIIVERLHKAVELNLLKRICLQTLIYGEFLQHVFWLVENLPKPISVSLPPQSNEVFQRLKDNGVGKVVIPIDGITENIFDIIKGEKADGPYRWSRHLDGIERAIKIFGEGDVGTHLMLGLGETEREAAELIQGLHDLGAYSALFAYTPIENTRLKREKPELLYYRRIQILHYIISNNLAGIDDMEFDGNGKVKNFGIDTKDIIHSGKPFITKGCPDCNRPFSTENPKVIYNFPRNLTEEEIEEIAGMLG